MPRAYDVWSQCNAVQPLCEGRKGLASMALDREARSSGFLDESGPRSTPRDDPSVRELLQETLKLVRQVVDMLNDPICEKHSRSASFRLARAHTLTLLDHLTRISESP